MSQPQALNVLIVEDNNILRAATVCLLAGQGHNAVGVMCAEEVDDSNPENLPDIYIVDINLPGENGLSLVRRVRTSEPQAGIILLSGRSELSVRLDGYENGADVYLTKPLDPAELIACVNALARRLAPKDAEAGVLLDPVRHYLIGPAGECALSKSETLLLAAFARAPQRQLEAWQAMRYVDPEDKGLSRANLEMRISALRRKAAQIGAPEPTIRAIRGFGYKLCFKLQVRTF